MDRNTATIVLIGQCSMNDVYDGGFLTEYESKMFIDTLFSIRMLPECHEVSV